MNIYRPDWREAALSRVGRSNWPGVHRLVNRLARKHASPVLARTNLFDLNYDADLSDLIDRNIFYFGAYSPEELYFLRDAAGEIAKSRNTVNFFDVGANCGQHSLFMARHVAAVHAFEPSQRVSQRFLGNIALSRIDNITLHRVALGESDGTIGLGSGFPGNSGSRSLTWSLPGEPLEEVEVRAAEAFFRDRDLPPIDLMKMDVEGYEKVVLRSLKERLDRDRPAIMMEFIKGAGFDDLQELRSALYPDHILRSLVRRRGGYEVRAFDWTCETLVVAPGEQAEVARLRRG